MIENIINFYFRISGILRYPQVILNEAFQTGEDSNGQVMMTGIVSGDEILRFAQNDNIFLSFLLNR